MKVYAAVSKMNTFVPKTLSLLIVSLLAISSTVQSNEVSSKTVDENKNTDIIETIVVTSRQSKENFLEVPLTISVMDEEFIDKRGFLNLTDAVRSVPGVDISDNGSPTETVVRIRGVGSLFLANRDDTSVTAAVDGASISTENLFLSLLDVAQIEVIKGPQGTVYGRNSEAGAINVTTNRPTDDFEANFRARYGQDAQYLAQGVVSGPLSNGFKGRFAVQKTGADHWVENVATDEPITKLSNLAMRGHLSWEDEITSILLTAEHHTAKGAAGIQLLKPYDEQPVISVAPERYKGNEKNVERLAFNIEHELDFGLLTSVTSHTRYELSDEGALDKFINEKLYGYPVESVLLRHVDDKATSQDIRISSLAESRHFWIAGISYWSSEHEYTNRNLGSPNSASTLVDNTNFGVYGEMTYSLNEMISLTGGLRLAKDKKDFIGTYRMADLAINDPKSIDDDYATGRVALTYNANDSFSIHFVGATGYKPGGFNEYATQPADSTPFKAAEVDSYEVGFKSVNAAYHLSVNGAMFVNAVKNDHVLGFDGETFATNVLNADTESKGAELDVHWLPVEGLTLSAALTYLDSEITTDVRGVFGGDVIAGNSTPDTPNWSSNMGIDWRHFLSTNLLGEDTAFDTSLTYRYQGARAADPQNNFILDAYSKIDLQLGLSNAHGRVYLWVDNLSDEQFDLYGYSFGFPGSETGAPARGRSIGIGIEYDFY